MEQLLVQMQDDSQITVQETENFLRGFSINDFNNPDTIAVLRAAEIPNNGIGAASAVGRIYDIKKNDGTSSGFVLKVSNMCPDGRLPASALLAQLCNMANNGDLVFRIPNTETGKMTILSPNYLLEAISGVLLDRLSPFTPSFMKIHGFQYDNISPEKSVLMVQEKLTDINRSIENGIDFLLTTFQIAQGLAVAQLSNRFVHYDLHQENIMSREIGPNKLNIYEIGNGEYLHTLRPYDTVIIDYGHIRMETSESVLTPSMKFANGREQLDYYDFNPYYDMFSFLIANYEKFTNGRFPNLPFTISSQNMYMKLWEGFLNIPPGQPNNTNFVHNFLHYVTIGNGWRAKPELLATPWTDPGTGISFERASTPKQMMAFIANELKIIQPPGNVNDAIAILTNNKYIVATQIIKINPMRARAALAGTQAVIGTQHVTARAARAATPAQAAITLTSHIYNLPIKQLDQTYHEYNIDALTAQDHTGHLNSISGSAISQIYYNIGLPQTIRSTWESWNTSIMNLNPANQHYHIAIIDVNKGIREGYKFRLDCCRLDMRTYFQDRNIEAGIGINATFFQNSSTFLPLGPFRTDTDGLTSMSDSLSSFVPIPPEYNEWYGIIAIDKKGNLTIDNPANGSKYGSILTTGAVLVWEGVNLTQPLPQNYIQSVNNGATGQWPRRINLNNPRFKCMNPPATYDNNNILINSCNNIHPGELSHAANPNPRSALGIMANGNVILVHVEGRNNRGAGMDLQQLSQLLISAGAVTGINLDGGRSSRLMWKNAGERIINQPGPTMNEAYPIGSIISFVKKIN